MCLDNTDMPIVNTWPIISHRHMNKSSLEIATQTYIVWTYLKQRYHRHTAKNGLEISDEAANVDEMQQSPDRMQRGRIPVGQTRTHKASLNWPLPITIKLEKKYIAQLKIVNINKAMRKNQAITTNHRNQSIDITKMLKIERIVIARRKKSPRLLYINTPEYNSCFLKHDTKQRGRTKNHDKNISTRAKCTCKKQTKSRELVKRSNVKYNDTIGTKLNEINILVLDSHNPPKSDKYQLEDETCFSINEVPQEKLNEDYPRLRLDKLKLGKLIGKLKQKRKEYIIYATHLLLTYTIDHTRKLPTSTPSKMPTASEANLAKRGRSQDDIVQPTNKKVCDPRTDAKAPKGKDLTTGKGVPLVSKTVTLPTEAQIRQAEIMKKARTSQDRDPAQDIPPSMPDLSVQVEDIGPEQDIFDKVINNPDYNTTDHVVDAGAETDAEGGTGHILDPTTRTDSYINVDYLPGPSNPGPSNPDPSHVQPTEQIDIGFVMALASDPYRALDIAKNVREVNQATEAIEKLEVVSKNYTKTNLKIDLYYKKNLSNLFQIRRRSASSVDWAEQVEQDELEQIKAARRAALARKIRIPAPAKPKESGFLPPSTRKNNGRGAKNTRGCLLYTSPSPRDRQKSRMPSSA